MPPSLRFDSPRAWGRLHADARSPLPLPPPPTTARIHAHALQRRGPGGATRGVCVPPLFISGRVTADVRNAVLTIRDQRLLGCPWETLARHTIADPIETVPVA